MILFVDSCVVAKVVLMTQFADKNYFYLYSEATEKYKLSASI